MDGAAALDEGALHGRCLFIGFFRLRLLLGSLSTLYRCRSAPGGIQVAYGPTGSNVVYRRYQP